jgi:hypothetical protein
MLCIGGVLLPAGSPARSHQPGRLHRLFSISTPLGYTSGGDLLGSKIYNHNPTNGFLYCVIATTLVYALILPLILLVPKELIATAEGEPNPRVAAEVLEEIADTRPA